MKDYTLTQQFALIGLDGLESNHASVAKSAIMRGIAAANFLQESGILEEAKSQDGEEFKNLMESSLKGLKKPGVKELRKLEEETREPLMGDGVLEEIPDLLECDLNYDTAGVKIKAYRTEEGIYTGITEWLRAEMLEEGPVTAEAFCLIWLLRETGCIHDLFSVKEQQKLNARMIECAAATPVFQALWGQEFHSSLEMFYLNFLKGKKKLFRNPFLEGVNLLFPFIERRQAIFIDFVVLGTTVKSRRKAVMCYLSERGHFVDEVQAGSETLLKIDNNYYRIFPKTLACNRVPIQGANLVPVYF